MEMIQNDMLDCMLFKIIDSKDYVDLNLCRKSQRANSKKLW